MINLKSSELIFEKTKKKKKKKKKKTNKKTIKLRSKAKDVIFKIMCSLHFYNEHHNENTESYKSKSLSVCESQTNYSQIICVCILYSIKLVANYGFS